MPDWSSTFEIAVPIGDLVLRGTATFLAILVLLRIVGQREAGGLGLTDVLVVVLAAEAAAPALHGHATTVGESLVVVFTVVLWSVIVDAVAFRWPRLGRVIKARAKVIIRDGRIDERVLRRELMTKEEVASMLRLEGIEDIDVVKTARLEPNGMVSIVRRDGAEAEAPDPPVA